MKKKPYSEADELREMLADARTERDELRGRLTALQTENASLIWVVGIVRQLLGGYEVPK